MLPKTVILYGSGKIKIKVCSYHCSVDDISATEHMTDKDSNTIPFEWDKKRYLVSQLMWQSYAHFIYKSTMSKSGWKD